MNRTKTPNSTKVPLIALLGEVDDDKKSAVKSSYVEAIAAAGGAPVLIPYTESGETLDALCAACDGFFFTGGADIAPEIYGERRSVFCGIVHPLRDELELATFRRAFALGKPILAVCRGAQLVNAALGGTLYQDIPSEIPSGILHRQREAVNEPSHSVNILKDSGVTLFGNAERIVANSFHHQAVKRLAPGLKTFAVTDDGIVEGFYMPGEQYLYAYQWHPERLWETDEFNRRIFESFIAACKKRS